MTSAWSRSLLGGALTGGVTWFHNDIKNLIVSGPAPAFQLMNIGRARTEGVESFWPGRRWRR